MRSLGAIVVGIGAYRYDRSEFPRLEYASNDAHRIVEYLQTCWPAGDDVRVVHVDEEGATLAAVTSAFSALGKGGDYDLQVVFLSGHGVIDTSTAGFVLQPPIDSSAVSLLESAEFDQLLASVSARRTILILDCCYAEGIVRRMRFFGGLDKSDARLFIASSREHQLTWEDDRVGHGIFTAHLLDLLNNGSSVELGGVREQLDVDGELFPVLCQQVPLYVFEHKQQRQEPVKGGISIRPVSLPVARSARRIKERTAFGTAIRRLRQIVGAIASACVLFLLLAYAFTYYAEADRNGTIRLRHGIKWLAPVFRPFPTLRADTGIPAMVLSDDPAVSYAVKTGATSGFWMQVSRQGYRGWYDEIRASLRPESGARYDVLLGSGATRAVDHLTEASRASEVAFAAWSLLDRADPKALDSLLAHLPGADRTSPLLTPFSINDLDFDIMDLTQPELASYGEALRFAATVDPDRAFTAYIGFLKANSIWLAHSSPEQHGREAQRRAADDVADLLAVIAKARADRGEAALDAEKLLLLRALGRVGYGPLVNLALSRVSTTPADRQAAATKALAAFHGHSVEPAEADALQQLKDTLDESSASQERVQEAYERFVAADGPEQADLTGFLIAAADRKSLPPSLIATLLSKASEAVARQDRVFMDTEYARILAHAMNQVPSPSRPLVYLLIALVAAGVTPLSSSTAEMYTALVRQRLDTPAMVDQIMAEASAAPLYTPADPGVVSEPLPGASIVVGYGPWLEALAILGTDRPLTPPAVDVLERHVDDPNLRDIIIRALAGQRSAHEASCWKTSCSQTLGAYPRDGTKRQLASDLLAQELAGLPREEFVGALQRLRQERASETEPEVRIALGLATMNAQVARVRTRREEKE